jgi:hypothetical protein
MLYILLSHDSPYDASHAPMAAFATTEADMITSAREVLPEIDPPKFEVGLVKVSLN